MFISFNDTLLLTILFFLPSRETVTIQAGQCGNQVGLLYWQQLASEHGITADGSLTPYPKESSNEFIDYSQQGSRNTTLTEPELPQNVRQLQYRNDNPELYFTVSDSYKYTPRSIMIDLEPSVISKALNAMPMFNPRNAHLSENGGGAANNWSNGYRYGHEHEEDILNLIDREVDKCDNLAHFQLMHSVAGGTGSGVGSKILEILQDRYSKKIITTVSVFPSNDKTSDVVVQPYNSVLTLKKLIECSHGTFVFHNDALNNIDNLLLNQSNMRHNPYYNHQLNDKEMSGHASFQGANKLIASVIASISNPIRFPGYMYSSIQSIMSSVIPTSDLKFLTTSIAPFSGGHSNHKYINEHDMFLELSDDRYKSVISPHGTDVVFVALMNYLISGSSLDRKEIRKGILKIQSRTNFPGWATRSVPVVYGKKSPFVQDQLLEGIQISNNTSVIALFEKILRQFDMLAKRKAYFNMYCEDNSAEEMNRVGGVFGECREAIVSVIDEYKACKSGSYLDDEEEDQEFRDDGDVEMN